MGNKAAPVIELSGRNTCTNSPKMKQNFRAALQSAGIANNYLYIDLASLPTEVYRRGYGTPTLLISGEDLFGMARPLPTAAAPS